MYRGGAPLTTSCVSHGMHVLARWHGQRQRCRCQGRLTAGQAVFVVSAGSQFTKPTRTSIRFFLYLERRYSSVYLPQLRPTGHALASVLAARPSIADCNAVNGPLSSGLYTLVCIQCLLGHACLTHLMLRLCCAKPSALLSCHTSSSVLSCLLLSCPVPCPVSFPPLAFLLSSYACLTNASCHPGPKPI